MKLRNKKTKDICEAEAREDGIYIKASWSDEEEWFHYDLETLASGWDYYVEPLIKNNKVRKAVRAWADAVGTDRAYLHLEHEEPSTFYVYNFAINCDYIQIAFHDKNPIEGERLYTIEELCGDEDNN